MSSMSTEAAPERRRAGGDARRAPVAGGAIAIAILAIVLLAHLAAGTPKAAPAAGASGAAGMAGMSAPSGMRIPAPAAGTVMTVRGASLPAVPTSSSMPAPMTMVPLGQGTWDGMRIQALTSAPATFALFEGTGQQVVHPTAKDSFHLMVTLADAQTNFAIPYSSVWATITQGGKIVFDERLWPMISQFMGPHYGSNVALPSAGLYHLTLLVSPPLAARHLEYEGRWLKPHRLALSFRWVPKGQG